MASDCGSISSASEVRQIIVVHGGEGCGLVGEQLAVDKSE